MFGTFDEKALAAYAEQVKEKKVKGGQGTEYADNAGVATTTFATTTFPAEASGPAKRARLRSESARPQA